MALSDLIEHPTYICTLPSSGKKIKYRPFIVKEEKALLLALQEGTLDAIAGNLENLIQSCTFGEVDPKKIPFFDMEYLFVCIRSKSVGEYVDLIGGCDCDEKAKTEFSVNLADVKVEGVVKNPVVQLSNDIYIKMRYLSLDEVCKLKEIDTDNDEEATLALAQMIGSVIKGDDVYEDIALEEKVNFIDELSKPDEVEISKFLTNLPSVKLETKYNCSKCGKEHAVLLEGIESFFA